MNFSIKRFYLSLYWCVDIALFILYYGNPHAGVGNGYINVYTVYYNLFLPVCLFVSVTVCMSLSLCLSLSLSVSVSCLFSSTGFLLTVFSGSVLFPGDFDTHFEQTVLTLPLLSRINELHSQQMQNMHMTFPDCRLPALHNEVFDSG